MERKILVLAPFIMIGASLYSILAPDVAKVALLGSMAIAVLCAALALAVLQGWITQDTDNTPLILRTCLACLVGAGVSLFSPYFFGEMAFGSNILLAIFIFSIAGVGGYFLHKRGLLTPAVEINPSFVDWIETHQPSLSEKGKKAYIECAKRIESDYYQERLAPTKSELLLARRRDERPLADVQMELFDRYRKLASSLKSGDGYPPFSLFPPDKSVIDAFNQLAENDYWYLSWSYKRSVHPKLKGTVWESEIVASSPFAPVVVAYEERG